MKASQKAVGRGVSRATQKGLAEVSLESTWWGNEKFGAWVDSVWAVIDHETDDAVHLAWGVLNEDDSPVLGAPSSFEDVWLPKSKIEVDAPDWTVHVPEPDVDVAGEVIVSARNETRYGTKACLWGDTYSAFKEDGVEDDLEWDDHHQTYNGLTWEVDVSSVEPVVDALVEAGYVVKVA